MAAEQASLPDFERPPVVEVALSIQFEAIADLRAIQLGALWGEFRERYPRAEEQAPLEPVFEEFGLPAPMRPRIRLERIPPVPRCWFTTEDSTHLLQVQQDRIVHNWRRGEGSGVYPRYKVLRDVFRQEIDSFVGFLSREGLGELRPNQCEVTYINEIAADTPVQGHARLEKLLTVWRAEYSDGFLPEPSDVHTTARYSIPGDDGTPVGRLNVIAKAAYRADDNTPVVILELTARGKPVGDGIEGGFRFLDIGHEWVVRGFASITTPIMHSYWGRSDDH